MDTGVWEAEAGEALVEGLTGGTDITVPFVVSILVTVLAILVCGFVIGKILRRTMYSYRLMLALGVLIFLAVALFSQFMMLIQYGGDVSLDEYYSGIVGSFANFAFLTFLVVIIFAGVLLISNLVLLIKMGWSFMNMLGALTGATVVVLVLFGFQIYDLIDEVFNIDSYGGFHFAIFIENVIFVAIVYFDCLMGASVICTLVAARREPKHDRDYIIVLGCYPGVDDELAPILRRRVERARQFALAQKNDGTVARAFVLSGGQGSDEVRSEAEAMARYLKKHPVAKVRMLLEDKSKNTRQNMTYSKRIIEKDYGDGKPKVAFVTTGYHVFRSGVIAESVGLNAEGAGSKTKWYYYINATVREYFANIISEKKAHIINVLALNLIMGALVLFSYINKIM